MHTNKLLFAALIAGTVIVAGCHKGESVDLMENPVHQTIDQNRMAATQTFTVNAATGGYVVGAKGTILTVAPNAFRTHSGALVSGNVAIEMMEAMDVADMVWLNMRTVGLRNGAKSLLSSGGQVRLKATSNSEQVNVVANAVTISMPTQDPLPAMRQFVGQADEVGNVLWEDAAPLAIDTAGQDSMFWGSSYYSSPWPPMVGGGEWPPFGYINCDNFPPPGGDSTDVIITLPSDFDRYNTMAWIVIPSLNCMVYMELGSGQQIRAGFPIATGLSGTVVTLSNVNGQDHSSFTPITITPGVNLTVSPQVTTMAQYQTDLQGL